MLVCEVPQIIFCGIRVVTRILFVPFQIDSGKGLFFIGNSEGTSYEKIGTFLFVAVYTKKSCEFCYRKIRRTVLRGRKEKGGNCNESITKSKQIFIRLYIIGGNRYCSSHILCTGNDGMGK